MINPECRPVRPLISAYFDGETDDQETRTVRQHLARCADCQSDLEAYRRIRMQFNRMQHPAAPPELRRAVLTEVHAIRTGRGRLVRRGFNPMLRFGTLVAGVATIAVIVALLVIVLGSNKNGTGTQPEIASVAQTVDGNTMVTFDKPVDPVEIQKNLQVTDPNGNKVEAEVSRIDDRTIKITLKDATLPDTPLNIVVNKGGPIQTPERFTVVANIPPTTRPASPATATATARPAQTTASAAGQTTTAPANATTAAANTTTATGIKTAAPITATATTAASPAVTATAAISPTVTATPVVSATVTATTTVTATVDISSTTTVTATATLTPTVKPTTAPAGAACKIVPARGFGKVYNEVAGVASKLLCPTEAERQATLAYESFTNGFMVYEQATDRIFVFYKTGKVEIYKNTYVEGEPTPTPAASCKVQPVRGFGKIWFGNSEVSKNLGCALAAENSSALAATQNYDQGLMFFYPNAANGKRIYVVYNNGTYLDVADTFVG